MSLFEQHNHRVADVEADVAAVVMRYRMTTFLYYKAVPIALVSSIKLLLNLSSDV